MTERPPYALSDNRRLDMTLPVDAVKRVIYASEAWYADSVRSVIDRGLADEWSLGIDPATGGGTYGEWSIQWLDLQGRLTWRLAVFGDGLSYAVASGLLDLLRDEQDAGPGQLREALRAAGWTDCTERRSPIASGSDVCSNCKGSGWDSTWHEGAPCAEPHACGYCRGGTYSGLPVTGGSTPNPTEATEQNAPSPVSENATEHSLGDV